MINISLKDIKAITSPAEYKRGMDYYNRRLVLGWEFDEDERAVFSTVQGTKPYVQEIDFDEYDIEGRCSCPMSYNCKHVAAVLIAAYYDKASNQNTSALSPSLSHESIDWLQTIERSFFSGEKNKKTSPKKLLYILKKNDNNAVAVQPYGAQLKKDGSLAKSSKYYNVDAFLKTHTKQASFLSFEDVGLLTSMSKLPHDYNGNYSLEHSIPKELLERIIQTERCHWNTHDGPIISLGAPKKSSLSWTVLQDGSQKLTCATLGESEEAFVDTSPKYINTKTGVCGSLDLGVPEKLALALLKAPTLNPLEADKVKEKLAHYAESMPTPAPIPLPQKTEIIEAQNIKPVPHLTLYGENFIRGSYYYSQDKTGEITGCANLSFLYLGLPVGRIEHDSRSTLTSFDDGKVKAIQRDFQAEKKHLLQLKQKQLLSLERYKPTHNIKGHPWNSPIWDDFIAGSKKHEPTSEALTNAWDRFMLEDIPKLQKKGWKITILDSFPHQILMADEGWYTDIEEGSGIDWFSFELGVNVEGKKTNLLPILLQALHDKSHAFHEEDKKITPETLWHFTMADGTKLALPAQRVQKMMSFLNGIFSYKELGKDGNLMFSAMEAAHALDMQEITEHLNEEWKGSKKLLELGQKSKDFKGIETVSMPKTVKADLRPYQQEGLNWLQFLRDYSFSGILADDMGLGKTLQALSHIALIKATDGNHKPILIITPTSVAFNWQMEAEKFTPSLKVLVLHGPDRKENFEKVPDHDIIVTTYPLISRDEKFFLEQQFDTIILDEAQYIKNAQTKLNKTICQLKANHRLSLTGTPVENHLSELWAQFNFLMPGFLGSKKEFKHSFRDPIEKHQSADIQKALARRVKPFVLRRDKNQVMTELPPKTVIVRNIELDKDQRDLYESIRISMHKKVAAAIAQKGLAKSHITVLDALLKLRQTCCDPSLLKIKAAQDIKKSAKLETLLDMLEEMIEEGRKILLFSQFTSMIKIIEERLTEKGIKYVKITGSTKDRKTPVETFQKGEVPLFIISLKAGGTGLNLTAADAVIHYDPWWNPAVEEQATDRAHRMGQDKPVFVYKLIASGTVEEKILEMQDKKRAVAKSIFDENANTGHKLSADDINTLFEPL
tara:strand:- start:84 stop:3440 length:3357 start_codon:yes stop_codon:yes gene_type:complete